MTVASFLVNHMCCLLLSSTFENDHLRFSNKYFTTWYKNNIIALLVEPVYSVALRAYINSVSCNHTRLSYSVCFAPALVPCTAYFLSVLIQLYWDRGMNILSRVPEGIFCRSLKKISALLKLNVYTYWINTRCALIYEKMYIHIRWACTYIIYLYLFRYETYFFSTNDNF